MIISHKPTVKITVFNNKCTGKRQITVSLQPKKITKYREMNRDFVQFLNKITYNNSDAVKIS